MKNIFILEEWNLTMTNLHYILKLEIKLLKQEVKIQTISMTILKIYISTIIHQKRNIL